jgi:RNA polymerase sigma-70 factor, ECF subfamily
METMDELLLHRARTGDHNAFAALCEPHRGRVWKTVYLATRRTADAEDLAQEVFLKAYQSLAQFRGDPMLFGAWLARIAVNAAHDWRKSAWIRRVQFWNDQRPETPDSAAPLSLQAETSERQQCVREAVARLAEKERTPIHLIYFEEYSLADVARLLELPESTIRSRVKVGLKRLGSFEAIQNLESDLSDVSPLSIRREGRETSVAV